MTEPPALPKPNLNVTLARSSFSFVKKINASRKCVAAGRFGSISHWISASRLPVSPRLGADRTPGGVAEALAYSFRSW